MPAPWWRPSSSSALRARRAGAPARLDELLQRGSPATADPDLGAGGVRQDHPPAPGCGLAADSGEHACRVGFPRRAGPGCHDVLDLRPAGYRARGSGNGPAALALLPSRQRRSSRCWPGCSTSSVCFPTTSLSSWTTTTSPRAPDDPAGMAFLLDHLPPQLHLVISTRADPALPFPGCGPAASWSRSAPPTCASPRRGRRLPQRHLTALTSTQQTSPRSRRDRGLGRSTPAGGVLAARPRGPVAFIAGFAGDDRFVVDYLADEVLEPPPDELRRLPARHLGPRPAHRPAVRRRHRPRRAARAGDARIAGAAEPVFGPARRPPPLVSLPPPVRRRAAVPPARRAPGDVPALHRRASRLVRRSRPPRGRGPACPGGR